MNESLRVLRSVDQRTSRSCRVPSCGRSARRRSSRRGRRRGRAGRGRSLKVPEEAEHLAGLDGRAGEDQAVDLLGHEGLDGDGHGQVGLPVPAGPMPKTKASVRMASTYFFWPTVLGLMERPRLVRTESPKTTEGRAAPSSRMMSIERPDGVGGEGVAPLQQGDELLEEAGHPFGVGLLAGDGDLVAADEHGALEGGLDQLEQLVPGSRRLTIEWFPGTSTLTWTCVGCRTLFATRCRRGHCARGQLRVGGGQVPEYSEPSPTGREAYGSERDLAGTQCSSGRLISGSSKRWWCAGQLESLGLQLAAPPGRPPTGLGSRSRLLAAPRPTGAGGSAQGRGPVLAEPEDLR